jgi:uncharacterized protein (TIGR03032 family)
MMAKQEIQPTDDPGQKPANEEGQAGNGAAAGSEERLRSVHTTNLPSIFKQMRFSLLVSTYQAGKLVMLRPDSEENLNTHFRTFKKPMGMAVGRNRLALGTAQEIWDFRNVPAVAPRLEPKGKVDACFLPREIHVTGDIQIHEMVYEEDELWFINTAFSCLCTMDSDHSFVPRWRPPFVTELAPGDRCHLNGLGMQDGKPRWVTMLGKYDTPGGWRENKKSGGLIMDLDSEEIVCRGLSMPHSPRWYADRLWVLESGNGSFGTVDLQTGRFEPIIQLPGFTRGLDFVGNLAFIGLSQVRETAVFSGIAITERLKETERNCGVWVVDIRSGQLVGFLKFEDAVQEIFAVSIVRGAIYPELIHAEPEILGSAFVLPDEALADVPTRLKASSEESGDESGKTSAVETEQQS